eukprot:TRINITY_DN18669_c0_g1_i1.p1 TRINITY_DN18669_c0_g1~~TRINITY_DN18669_c0_g1_i1.p1  ORF type:complete len:147 (+),score=26.88 TRINITY_DN18669_c0_g1_i1:65-505(+)
MAAGGIIDLAASICHAVLRAFVAFAAALTGAVLSATGMAMMNDVFYGRSGHRILGALLAGVPTEVNAGLLLVLPPGFGFLYAISYSSGQEGQKSDRSRLARAVFAGFVAGLVLGILASPAPGPYGASIDDHDITDKVNRHKNSSEL